MQISETAMRVDTEANSNPNPHSCKQTAVVVFILLLLSLLPLFAITLLIGLLFTPCYWLSIIYAIFYVIDLRTPSCGGWRCRILSRIFPFADFAAYFPAHLQIADASQFDDNKNYILCGHPHGIMPFGTMSHQPAIAQQLGLRVTPMMLAAYFYLPFAREFLMSIGVLPVNSKVLEHFLTKEGKGNAIVITPGGLPEILKAKPRTMALDLSRMRGLIRMALTSGANLVPMITFGLNDLYDILPVEQGPFVRRLQTQVLRLIGVKAPLFYGRGICGILPKQLVLTTVIGRPISFSTPSAAPTVQDMDALYSLYVNELVDLYDEHKDDFGCREVPLVIA